MYQRHTTKYQFTFVLSQNENLLDLNEHVRDAEGQSSGQVDEDKRIHSGQEDTAQTWDDPTQTGNTRKLYVTIMYMLLQKAPFYEA